MTEQVLLRISGLQLSEESGGGPVEVLTMADYYYRNGAHYLLYEEPMDRSSEVIRNTVKLKPGYVEIRKKGLVNACMVFERWKEHPVQYETPFGTITAQIRAGEVELREEKYDIHADLNYMLEFGGDYLTDCRVNLHVKSKDAPDFSLGDLTTRDSTAAN